jgi:hypothetical protein
LGIIGATLLVGALLPLIDGQTVLQLIAHKQEQFTALRAGNSNIALPDMQPTLAGLATNLPTALYNQFIAPFTLPHHNWLYWPAVIDHAFFLLLFVVGLLSIRKPMLEKPPLLTALFFGLMLLVLIGLIVPNLGAILRYRSLAIPFLLLPLLAGRKTVE